MAKEQTNKPKVTRICLANGIRVGWVVGDVFIKHLQGSKHKLRQPPAWAFSAETLNQALHAGATRIHILDTENLMVYETTMQHLKIHGCEFDRGHGRQIYLYIKRWDIKPRARNNATRKPAAEPSPQLPLFNMEDNASTA